MGSQGSQDRADDAAARQAAQRALDDSRDAIAALVRPNDEPLADTLARAAEQVGRRERTSVELDVPPRVAVDPAAREALLRIMREAVTNAAQLAGLLSSADVSVVSAQA